MATQSGGETTGRITSEIKNSPGFSNWLVVSIVLSLALMCGCASSSSCKMATSLTNFSTATGDVQAVSRAALDKIQSVGFEKTALNAAGKSEIAEGEFVPFLSTADVYQRLLALDALTAYANKMKLMSGLDKREDVKKNFFELKNNLDSMSRTISGIPGVEHELPGGVLESMAQIGQVLANMQIARKTDRAVYESLEKTDPLVSRICGLISSEFSDQEGLFYNQLEMAYREQETALLMRFKAAKDVQTRTPIAKEYGTVLRKKQLGLALCVAIADSYGKIAQAHHAFLLQSKNDAASNDELNALNAQIKYTRFIFAQMAR